MTTTIEKLEAEKRRLDAQRKRLNERVERLREEYRELEHEEERIRDRILAEKLKELIGKPVRVRHRVHSSDRHAWMNDAVGTLLEVKQTMCFVDYGDVGKEHDPGECSEWELPIRDVVTADEPQPVLPAAVRRMLARMSDPKAA